MATDVEKIIADLEHYRVHPNIAGMENYGDTIVSIPESLLNDILFVLRCEQPRLLTLEEVIIYRNKPIWLETLYSSNSEWAICRAYNSGNGILSFTVNSNKDLIIEASSVGYGETWRCWSYHPTKEQRKSTPWETKGE